MFRNIFQLNTDQQSVFWHGSTHFKNAILQRVHDILHSNNSVVLEEKKAHSVTDPLIHPFHHSKYVVNSIILISSDKSLIPVNVQLTRG